MQLRLFHRERACTSAADSVRAHLLDCDACRAIVASLEAGDTIQWTLVDEHAVPAERVLDAGDTNQNTLAYEHVVPARPVLEAAHNDQNTVDFEPVDPARQVFSPPRAVDVLPVSSDTATLAGDATVCLSAGAAGKARPSNSLTRCK